MSIESSLADGVEAALDVDPNEFTARAEAEAATVKDALHDGVFDNHQSIVGFEYEFYAVADGRWSEESRAGDYALMRVPRRLLELMGFEKELGLHNAEMCTSPQPLSNHGLRAQLAEVRARLEAAENCAGVEGMRLVSDGVWTIPPAGESAAEYLTDSADVDGVTVAANMSDAVRYHAMANAGHDDPIVLNAPGVTLTADTVMPESLITSIQPHYQVAQADTLPVHFRYALRVAGPLLALGVNSPFVPPALYDDGWDGERVLAEGHLRVRAQRTDRREQGSLPERRLRGRDGRRPHRPRRDADSDARTGRLGSVRRRVRHLSNETRQLLALG